MRRFLWLLVLCLVFAGQTAAAAELECLTEIQTTTALVTLTSYYAHTDGGVPYSNTTSVLITEGPGFVYASSEGHPIGHVWVIDEQIVAECGLTPNVIFFDGFESGDLSAWQLAPHRH